MTNVQALNDKQLVNKIKFLISEERKNISAQIVILKEIKSRNLAIAMGYPSLLEFCVQELGLTKDQAWKRSQAAGAIAREPALFQMLKTGQTSLSSLAVVSAKLSEKTAEEIKAFLPQKSKREVEAFVSNLNRDGTRENRKQTVKVVLNLEPQVLDKLDKARRLLKQNRINVSQEDVLEQALDLLLEKKDPVKKAERARKREESNLSAARRKLKAKTDPAKEEEKKKGPAPEQVESKAGFVENGRYIPAKIRHGVFSRSDQRCSFRSESGRRCKETRALQIDHIKMYCHGGEHKADNLRLVCPAHNRFLAEKALGGMFSISVTG